MAHAFLLTGIRGVGKTTTARIIAKALNCVSDGNKKEPTFEICNECSPCKSINNGNFLDVIEVDAASRTGVDGIREIIDSVMYSPNNARYKVYIIDEVHMLSNAAFNALLKTLEEPPQNVKFIFATTEIKKIPATIISRCQKFDLQRVDIETLTNHLNRICKAENISYENDSIYQICKASEGSVRDALSLLDQAASLCQDNIKDEIVLSMLGLNGYEKNLELFELCLLNKCEEALKVYDDILQNGIQPVQIISNLLEISHLASRVNIIKFDPNITESLQESISKISSHGLPKIVKFWQILIKSVEELRYAPNEQQAGSMAIIKLCYGSLMPDPSEFLEKISNQTKDNLNNNDTNNVKTNIENDLKEVKRFENPKNVKTKNIDFPKTFEEVLNLLLVHKEALLHAQIINNVHLISFSEGLIKIRLKDNTDTEILKKLSSTLENITKTKWLVSQSEEEGEKTIVEKQNSELDKNKEKIKSNPHFAEVFKHFPQAEITSIEDKDSS